jgi:hypothetical protein
MGMDIGEENAAGMLAVAAGDVTISVQHDRHAERESVLPAFLVLTDPWGSGRRG